MTADLCQVLLSCCSVAQSCPTLCDPMNCSMPGYTQSFTISWNLVRFMSIELVMLSNYLILCWPLFPQPSIFPSIRVFSNESVLHIRCSKYWRFRSSISLSNEYSGLISLGGTGLISLQPKGLSRVFSSTAVQKHRSSALNLPLEKEMATHSSVLAWRIPGKGEPGGLLSMGSHRVRHD